MLKQTPNITHVCQYETFEECSISLEFKEGDNFNHRNTFDLSYYVPVQILSAKFISSFDQATSPLNILCT